MNRPSTVSRRCTRHAPPPRLHKVERGWCTVVEIRPVALDGGTAVGVVVELPRTRLVAVATERGYVMCGALDVDVLNTRLAERRVLAGRAFGVRSIDDLLAAPLTEVTDAARELGVEPGMSGREALQRFL